MAVRLNSSDQDLVIPATLIAAVVLILPDLQTQPWWLILPCLICLILRWRTLAFVFLFAAMSYADTWLTGFYYIGLILLLLMRMYSDPLAGSAVQLVSALRQVVMALPLLVVIMLLAVVAGWSDPRSSSPSQSMTGVSDTMTPGSVSRLVNDSDLAMRVRFAPESPALLPEDLYWRGIVLENFDGTTWSRSNRLQFDLDPMPVQVAQPLQYLVSLEPSRQFWLYGLHQAYTSRPQTYRDVRGMLITSDMLRQRVRYPVSSIEPAVESSLDSDTRQRNLSVPANSNPRTQQWVGHLQSQYPDDHALTAAILRHFGEAAFYYTLTPTASSGAQIDDFLFDSREGYCEHYAGALTFMLRIAGIPARVVAGYQGGDFNPITGHWNVYQYNAHAWVEAWYPDTGWQRLDPTASIAPERISVGIDAWLASLNERTDSTLERDIRRRLQLATIPGYQSMRTTLDALQYSWRLGIYDSEGNLRTEDLNDWLTRQGLGSLPVWLLAALLLFVGVRAMWGGRSSYSPAVQTYLRLDARLRRLGLGRRQEETIMAHMERVDGKYPDRAAQWQKLGRMISEAEYGNRSPDQSVIRDKARELTKSL
jgi:transglutaminase-like putative cysteine protease